MYVSIIDLIDVYFFTKLFLAKDGIMRKELSND